MQNPELRFPILEIRAGVNRDKLVVGQDCPGGEVVRLGGKVLPAPRGAVLPLLNLDVVCRVPLVQRAQHELVRGSRNILVGAERELIIERGGAGRFRKNQRGASARPGVVEVSRDCAANHRDKRRRIVPFRRGRRRRCAFRPGG